MNRVLLVGRVGDDPEIRFSPGGTVFARIPVATERPRKKEDKWTTETDWHTVIQIARALSSVTAQKGDLVAVEGALRTRSWEKDGERKWTTEVVANRVRVLAKSRKNAPPEKETSETADETIPPEEIDAAEIPFC